MYCTAAWLVKSLYFSEIFEILVSPPNIGYQAKSFSFILLALEDITANYAIGLNILLFKTKNKQGNMVKQEMDAMHLNPTQRCMLLYFLGQGVGPHFLEQGIKVMLLFPLYSAMQACRDSESQGGR